MGLEVGDNEITPDVVLYRRKIAGYLVTFQQLLQNIAVNPANEPVRLRIPTQLVYHTGDIDTLAARLVLHADPAVGVVQHQVVDRHMPVQ